jgi:hypothetical protein
MKFDGKYNDKWKELEFNFLVKINQVVKKVTDEKNVKEWWKKRIDFFISSVLATNGDDFWDVEVQDQSSPVVQSNWRSQLLASQNGEDDIQKLQKAGYVEETGFKEFVEKMLDEDQELKGYYCATCEYAKQRFCTKLNTNIKSFGCCNLWEYKNE